MSRAPSRSAWRSPPQSRCSSCPAPGVTTLSSSTSRISPRVTRSSTSPWFPSGRGRRQNEDVVDTDQDPRIERSRRVILEAALEELGVVGYGALTIEAVAARAGVGKSTIYRHWSGKLDLVEDAFRTLKAQALVPETGSIRERLIAFLGQIANQLAGSTYSACMPALIDAAERDPQVRELHCALSTQGR